MGWGEDYASSAGARGGASASSDATPERVSKNFRADTIALGVAGVIAEGQSGYPRASTRQACCICALKASLGATYSDFEVVVDSQLSESEVLTYLMQLERKTRGRALRYDRPFNHSAIKNWAVARYHCPPGATGLPLSISIGPAGPTHMQTESRH